MKTFFSAAALAVLLAGCHAAANKNPLPASGDAIPVKLAPISVGSSQTNIETTGLLSTEDESKLAFKLGGVVDAILVDEGSFVRKGQVLATLKTTEIASEVGQVNLGVEKAQRDYQRVLNLYNDSVATLEQLQNAKTGLDIARQGLSVAQFNQQYARIYAPADGFVVRRLLSAGEIAAPGMPVLVLNHVSGSSNWVLKCGVTDQEWASLKEGQTATVRFDAFAGKELKATVSKKALAADMTNGSFSVELRVQMAGLQPAVGMFGKASIATGTSQATASIPYSALLEADGAQGYVFVTNDRQTVQRIPVQLGRIYNEQVEVLQGLEGYNAIVVSGSAYLSHQSRIRIVQ